MRFIEAHLIHPLPPSCINREESNRPKTCKFGGYSRSRVSSQCWKRSIRLNMQTSLSDMDFAVRTMPEKHLAKAIADLVDEKTANEVANLACSCFFPKSRAAKARDAKKESKAKSTKKGSDEQVSETGDDTTNKEDEKKAVLRFLSKSGYDRFVSLVRDNIQVLSAGTVCDELKSLLSDALFKRSPGIGVFGRMIAELPEHDVESAVQVAHAISTNVCDTESDYFTAIDDLNATDDKGAAHLNDQEFVCPVYYRYLAMNVEQLDEYLQNDEHLRKIVAMWLTSIATIVPQAKKTSFAHFALPEFMAVTYKTSGAPTNLVGAFMNPVLDNLAVNSVNKLCEYWNKLSVMFPQTGLKVGGFATIHDLAVEPVSWEKMATVDELIDKITRGI